MTDIETGDGGVVRVAATVRRPDEGTGAPPAEERGPRLCVAAAIRRSPLGEQVLVGKHAGAGKWLLPGGKVQIGETPEEALVREVREETNLRIGMLRLSQVKHVPEGWVTIVYTAVAANEDDLLEKEEEFHSLRWVGYEQAAMELVMSIPELNAILEALA